MKRRDLAAFLECGCVAIIMVVESDNFTASAKNISDFYASVHKCQTRKNNPIKLRVEEISHKDWKMGCPICQGEKQYALFAKEQNNERLP